MRTRIKICGVRDAETMRAAWHAGADAIGLVFVDKSPRFIEPRRAWDLVAACPPLLTTVGLFQDCEIEEFIRIEQTCPTTLTQLHGNESDELICECGPQLIKSVHYNKETIAADLRRLDAIDEIDMILIDGSAGGMGEALDWQGLRSVLDAVQPTAPIVLAGGLTPGNVGEAIRTVRPFAVDVSSGVERERGVKDAALIEAFCDAVRAADRS